MPKRGEWALMEHFSSYAGVHGLGGSSSTSLEVVKVRHVVKGIVKTVDDGSKRPVTVGVRKLAVASDVRPEVSRRFQLAFDKRIHFANLDVARKALTTDGPIESAASYATLDAEDVGTNPRRRVRKVAASRKANPRKRSAFKPPYTVQTWFERDRQHVELQDSLGATVVEWWDDDVSQAVEDGFLDPRNYLKSATEYAKEMGLIS